MCRDSFIVFKCINRLVTSFFNFYKKNIWSASRIRIFLYVNIEIIILINILFIESLKFSNLTGNYLYHIVKVRFILTFSYCY